MLRRAELTDPGPGAWQDPDGRRTEAATPAASATPSEVGADTRWTEMAVGPAAVGQVEVRRLTALVSADRRAAVAVVSGSATPTRNGRNSPCDIRTIRVAAEPFRPGRRRLGPGGSCAGPPAPPLAAAVAATVTLSHINGRRRRPPLRMSSVDSRRSSAVDQESDGAGRGYGETAGASDDRPQRTWGRWRAGGGRRLRRRRARLSAVGEPRARARRLAASLG